MARTILNGGDSTQQNQYTGPLNELTVDESNGNLRLHNGATTGGIEFLNKDNITQEFQKKSPELAGLEGFEPQDRGFWVRLGPADFVLRKLLGDSANITITYGDGYTGNPLISLSESITTDHIWSGEHQFTQPVTLTGGAVGNLAGNTTGTHTGAVVGNVTGNLTGDATGDHEGTFTGSIDIRGSTFLADSEQIPAAAVAGLAALLAATGLNTGCIIDFYGLIGDIPDGWYLCDGTNGTPDLRNRFVVGAGDSYAVGATGGANSQAPAVTIDSAGAHTHSLTGTVQSAATGYTVTGNKDPSTTWDKSGSTGWPVTSVSTSDPGHTHDQSGTAASSGSHTHTGTVSSFDNRPPYFGLFKIMKG